MANEPDKICASCGRAFAWRKAWDRDWEQVRYCSDACRRRKVRPVDRALEDSIRELLAVRGPGASICPSEAARRVAASRSHVGSTAGAESSRAESSRAVPAGAESSRAESSTGAAGGGGVQRPVATTDEESWRDLLEPARRAARRLVASGEVELTQRGRVVDPSSFRGPVQIRRSTPR
jgi:hypothetical protein